MVLFLYQIHTMKNALLSTTPLCILLLFLQSCTTLYASTDPVNEKHSAQKKQNYQIVYFNPQIEPNIEEIKFPTYQAFFDGMTQKTATYDNIRIMRIDDPQSYQNVDLDMVRSVCKHNQSNIAIVPKIKYFKVGLGKYVFSNQVVVTLKMYDANGNLLAESEHDTYKKNRKLLSNTENSIRMGVSGAMDGLLKKLKYLERRN